MKKAPEPIHLYHADGRRLLCRFLTGEGAWYPAARWSFSFELVWKETRRRQNKPQKTCKVLKT
jgi:hypothetical protein